MFFGIRNVLSTYRNNLPFYRQKWKRLVEDGEYTKGEDGLEVSFKHNFKSGFKSTDYVLLAYIYPFTYLDHMFSISEIE